MPSLTEALNNVFVLSSLKDAWEKTQKSNHEWGGWIYYIPLSNSYSIKLKTDKGNKSIILTRPKDLQDLTKKDYTIISDFHCHPGGEMNACKPSNEDISGAKQLTYHRLVFTYDTNLDVHKVKFLMACDPRPTPENFPKNTIMWWIC